MTWEDIEVGRECEPYEYVVTEEAVQGYLNALGIGNPWYTHDSPFGGPIAPGLISKSDAADPNWWFPFVDRSAFLHARSEFEFIHPLRVGKKVTVKGRWVEKYQKRDRNWATIEAVAVDEDGLIIVKSRTTHTV
jgi:acyl dehydratase